jgi:hypothetical protein
MVSPRRALIRGKVQLPDRFDPKRYRLNDAALDYGIEEARRIKDWDILREAIDAKIGEQFKFVGWWKANIAKPGRPKINVDGPVHIKREKKNGGHETAK